VRFQSSRRLHIPIIIFHQHFSRHKFCYFDQLLSLSHHGKLCATTDLLSSAISGDKVNQRWRLTWEIVMFLDTTLRLYPSRNSLLQTVLGETLQLVLWLNLAVTSFRVCRLFVFTLRKRILLSRGIVFRIPPLRGKFSMFPLSLIRFINFLIVLLLMPVILCIL
jgi:hypothetical protein